MQQEFRWEHVEIGQGHYHSDIGDCFRVAVDVSRKNPDHTIKIEVFRPKREVIGFLKDGKFLTPDQMEKMLKKLIEHFDEQLKRARGFEADEDQDSRYWQGNADALEGTIADIEEMMKEQKKK